MFSYETCEIFKNTYFEELFKNTFFYGTPPVAASENNEQHQLSEVCANCCCKIVSPILVQKLINDFVVCKNCSGTLVEYVTSWDGFGNQNYIFRKGVTLFNRST